MATLPIQLDGRRGLTDLTSNTTDSTVGRPEMAYNAQDGELVSGLFNPYVREGYLFPAKLSSQSVADLGAGSYHQYSSSQYDSLTGQSYFGQRRGSAGPKISRLDNLNDVTLTDVFTLSADSVISDLELYSINSERKLMYVYDDSTLSFRSSITAPDNDWHSMYFAVNPSSTTRPSVINRIKEDFVATSFSTSVNVPSATSTAALVVITYRRESALSAITFGGTAMTLVTSYDFTTRGQNFTTALYSRTGLTVGANTLSTTMSVAFFASMSVIITDNTSSSTPVILFSGKRGLGTKVEHDVVNTTNNCLHFQYVVTGKTRTNVGSPTSGGTYNPNTQTAGLGSCMTMSEDGLAMYVSGSTGGATIFQYTLGTAWDVTTATYASKFHSLADSPNAIQWRVDGQHLYDLRNATKTIVRTAFTTAFDVSTATTTSTFNFTSVLGTNPADGFVINRSGTKLYLASTDTSREPAQVIYEFDFGTAWSVTTLTYSGRVYRTSLAVRDLRLADDGLKLYATDKFGSGNLWLFEFDINDPGNIEKLVYKGVAGLGNQHNVGYVRNEGIHLFTRRLTDDDCQRWNLPDIFIDGEVTTNQTIHTEGATSGRPAYILSSNSSDPKLIEVGHTTMPSGLFRDDNWLTETKGERIVSYSDYNFLRVADNGFAYLFAGNSVSKIDGEKTGGATGFFSKNVLLFPESFTIKDAVDYRSNLYICIHQHKVSTEFPDYRNFNGVCGIYVWDRLSTKISSASFIELPGVKEIRKIYVSPDQVLKLIVVSANGLTELREFGYNDSGGVIFRTVKRLLQGSAPLFPDGYTPAGDKSIWLGMNGLIYCEKGNSVSIISRIGTTPSASLTLNTTYTPGALLYIGEGSTVSAGLRGDRQGLYASWFDSGGPAAYVVRFTPFDTTDSTNAGGTPIQGDVYTPVKLLPEGSRARNVRVYNLPISGSGTSVIATVKVYFNQKTVATRPSGMTKTITKDEARRGYVDFRINEPYVHAIQIEIEWATGELTNGDVYLPSVAIITYDETTQQSPDNG